MSFLGGCLLGFFYSFTQPAMLLLAGACPDSQSVGSGYGERARTFILVYVPNLPSTGEGKDIGEESILWHDL
ncbi:hypothetical protein F5Y17DRAFT_447584, partial [Xylariaceae sp. FL0594]